MSVRVRNAGRGSHAQLDSASSNELSEPRPGGREHRLGALDTADLARGDESTEHLDAEATALLVTSHNMVEVERLCERVVFVSGGHVVANGTPADVAAAFNRADLEEVFLHLSEQRTEGAG